jgi:hypothetical protein
MVDFHKELVFSRWLNELNDKLSEMNPRHLRKLAKLLIETNSPLVKTIEAIKRGQVPLTEKK